MQIPTINIATKGETYYIKNKQINMETEETKEHRGQEDSNTEHEGYYQDESWKPVKASKKRKTTTDTSAIGNPVTEKQRWLQELPLSNSFNSLTEEIDSDPVSKTTIQTNHITKPPPILVEAQIIDPLIDLLNNLDEKNNYTIKQTKLEQVKIQTNTPETFRKVIKALKEKNAIYHTHQLKTERSYKIVIRGLHPKTNVHKLSDELAKIGHQTRTINNITRFDTKQPLPLFLIELEPRINNKEIYDIKQILNTIVTVEPPRHKKDIPQCMRCQQYGHTKNYCNRSPACVKCAKNHLTAHCPYSGKIEKVKCFNCNGNHPASYKGCEVRKQLQRKLFPPLRSRTSTNTQAHHDSTKPETLPNTEQAINTKPISTNTIGGLSYAQVTSQPTHTHNQYHSNSNNDTAEIKELLKQSIKNTEMLTRMISEQNAVLKQQTQQITVMLQLITNVLSKK